jgi:hypothetical protein
MKYFNYLSRKFKNMKKTVKRSMKKTMKKTFGLKGGYDTTSVLSSSGRNKTSKRRNFKPLKN